jgi:hypothetical protein
MRPIFRRPGGDRIAILKARPAGAWAGSRRHRSKDAQYSDGRPGGSFTPAQMRARRRGLPAVPGCGDHRTGALNLAVGDRNSFEAPFLAAADLCYRPASTHHELDRDNPCSSVFSPSCRPGCCWVACCAASPRSGFGAHRSSCSPWRGRAAVRLNRRKRMARRRGAWRAPPPRRRMPRVPIWRHECHPAHSPPELAPASASSAPCAASRCERRLRN